MVLRNSQTTPKATCAVGSCICQAGRRGSACPAGSRDTVETLAKGMNANCSAQGTCSTESYKGRTGKELKEPSVRMGFWHVLPSLKPIFGLLQRIGKLAVAVDCKPFLGGIRITVSIGDLQGLTRA